MMLIWFDALKTVVTRSLTQIKDFRRASMIIYLWNTTSPTVGSFNRGTHENAR